MDFNSYRCFLHVGHFSQCWISLFMWFWVGFDFEIFLLKLHITTIIIIIISHMRIVILKQGQIKTGAPCRSERLAKYNQVKFHHYFYFPLNLFPFNFSSPNLLSFFGPTPPLGIIVLVLRSKFQFQFQFLLVVGYCSFLGLKKSLDQLLCMQEQNSVHQWNLTRTRTRHTELATFT